MRQVGDCGRSLAPKPPYFLINPFSRAVSRTAFAGEYPTEWMIPSTLSLPGTGVNMTSKGLSVALEAVDGRGGRAVESRRQ